MTLALMETLVERLLVVVVLLLLPMTTLPGLMVVVRLGLDRLMPMEVLKVVSWLLVLVTVWVLVPSYQLR